MKLSDLRSAENLLRQRTEAKDLLAFLMRDTESVKISFSASRWSVDLELAAAARTAIANEVLSRITIIETGLTDLGVEIDA